MFAKPIKTYLRKGAQPMIVPPLAAQTIPMPAESGDDENENKSMDILDDTFDRLKKTAKPVPRPATPDDEVTTSFVDSSDSNSSELELIPIPGSANVASPKRPKKGRAGKKGKAKKPRPEVTKTTFRSEMQKRVDAVANSSEGEEEHEKEKEKEIGSPDLFMGNTEPKKRYSDPPDVDSSPDVMIKAARKSTENNFQRDSSSHSFQDSIVHDTLADAKSNPTATESNSKETSAVEASKSDSDEFESSDFKIPTSRVTTRKRRKSISKRNSERGSAVVENVKKSPPKRRRRNTHNSSLTKDELETTSDKSNEKESNVSELISSANSMKECWVSLTKLEFNEKIKQKLDAEHRARYKDSSNSLDGPASILVSELSDQPSIEMKSFELPLHKLLRPESISIPQGKSIESSSMFSSEDQSTAEEPQKNPPEQLNSSQNQSPSYISQTINDQVPHKTTRKSSAASKKLAQPCSVILQRLNKPSTVDHSTLHQNQSMLSSTPLVSRIRDKRDKIYLSPIALQSPLISDVAEKETETVSAKKSEKIASIRVMDEYSEINLTAAPPKVPSIPTIDEKSEIQLTKQSQKIPSLSIVDETNEIDTTKASRKMPSTSIIDEDTELESGVSNNNVNGSAPEELKVKIERQLFVSRDNIAEEIHETKKVSFVLSESTREPESSIWSESSIDISQASDVTSGVWDKEKLDNLIAAIPVVASDVLKKEKIHDERSTIDDPSEIATDTSNKENNPQNDQTDASGISVSTSYQYVATSPLLFNDETGVSLKNEDRSRERAVSETSGRQSSLSSSRSMSPLIFEDESPKKEETINSTETKEAIIDPTPEKNRKDLQAMLQPTVVLTRLYDPIGVTQRRNKLRSHLTNRLSAINENGSRNIDTVEENDKDHSKIAEKSGVIDDGDDKEEKEAEVSLEGTKHVFLKPGKSWARSLSILNHIQRKEDIEALAAGKGKNWRESVISVLNMQNQGAVQGCLSQNENDKDGRASHRFNASQPAKWSSSNRFRIEPTSPERFTRRISIRVLPDNKGIKSVDKQVHDSSFLKAYGITTSKDRQTLVKRSVSPSRKTSYNFRASKVAPKSCDPSTVARSVVLERCNQKDSRPFSQFYSEDYLNHCRKIGEGVYGEVFLFDKGREKSVIKIIPIEGSEVVNGEPQKKFDEILSEIIIAKELHNLRINEECRTDGFVEVKNIRCLKGKYPEKLVELWKTYDDEKRSDNDCPSMFSEDQLYIALELGDGGKDLEGFVFQNASEAYSSFIQTALSLAVAEKSLDFEHRDLHWGNILISRTNDKETTYKLNNEEITYSCQGVKVSIIDFTLSRMSYEGCCIFNDLALDPSLFDAVGEYQFEIYRLMRAKVGNDWQKFEPYTNILWLHYTLDKMITVVRYKRKGTKIHNTHIQKLKELKDVILDYDSAFDFVTNCEIVRDLLQIS